MKYLGFSLVLLLACCRTMAQPDAPHAAVIELLISGGEPGKGQFLLDLFDSEERYMKEPAWQGKAAVGDDGTASVGLGPRPAGRYALVVVYDRNGDGKLNTGLFRIPREKIGYSNNAKGRLGPAKWRDVAFDLKAQDLRLTIAVDNVKKGK